MIETLKNLGVGVVWVLAVLAAVFVFVWVMTVIPPWVMPMSVMLGLCGYLGKAIRSKK